MDSMTLFIASLAVSCIGALASVLLIKADNAAKTQAVSSARLTRAKYS